jgi:hypothetical protein
MRRVVLENVVARQRQSDRAQHPPDSQVIVLLPINDVKNEANIPEDGGERRMAEGRNP